MSDICVCGHYKEDHDVCGWGSEVEHFCRGCIKESTRKNYSECRGFRQNHAPVDVNFVPEPVKDHKPLETTDENLLIRFVTAHYPRARKSLCSGRILMGEDSLILGNTWQEAADNICKSEQAHIKPAPTNVEAMEQIIKNIAKINLGISKLQMQALQEYHELHTRLERIKRDGQAQAYSHQQGSTPLSRTPTKE